MNDDIPLHGAVTAYSIMDRLPDLTIFIPTHNRPCYLRRALDYFGRYDHPFPILICDSSREPFPGLKPTPQILYRHCPDTEYLVKLREGLDMVGTEYLVMGADDDFIVPRAIEQCLSYLEAHADHSSVQGHYVSFCAKSRIPFKASYVENYAMRVQSDSPAERLIEQFNPYMHQFYAVHRTKNFRDAFNGTQEWNHNGILIEIIVAMMAAINGKHSILPIFFSAKEEIADSAGSTFAGMLDISSFPRYHQEYEFFLRSVARHLSLTAGMEAAEARRWTEKAMDTYFEVFLPRHFGSPGFHRLKSAIKKALPKGLLHPLLDLYRSGRDIVRNTDGQFHAYFDLFDEASKGELDMIRKVVREHESTIGSLE